MLQIVVEGTVAAGAVSALLVGAAVLAALGVAARSGEGGGGGAADPGAGNAVRIMLVQGSFNMGVRVVTFEAHPSGTVAKDVRKTNHRAIVEGVVCRCLPGCCERLSTRRALPATSHASADDLVQLRIESLSNHICAFLFLFFPMLKYF